MRARDALAVAPEQALRGLVADLNAIEERYGLIDTNYREQAAAAFFDPARRARVPTPDAEHWFATRTW